MAPRLILAISLLAACSFEARFDGTGYRCGTGGQCPSGQMCVEGYCRTGPLDGDAGADPDGGPGTDAPGGGPDGATPVARCGTVTLLADDFEDGQVGQQWYSWSDSGASVSETGGQLVLSWPAGSTDAWAGYTSTALHDITDSALVAEIAATGGDYTLIEVRSWDDPRAQFLIEDSQTLIAAVYSVADEGVRNSISYVANDHRYIRIRESGGTLYWEHSPDLVDWTELHSESNPFPPDDVLGIVSGGGQVAGGASEAHFEAVNPGAASSSYCPLAELTDGFDASGLRPRWDTWSETGCTNTETAGQLVMAFTGADDVWCGAVSSHRFDLTGSEMIVEVAEAPAAATYVTYTQVILSGDDTTKLEIGHDSGTLYFTQDVDGVTVNEVNVDYNATTHRFWRFAESSGQVQLSTSPDGSTWTTHLDEPAAFALTRVHGLMGAGNYNPSSAATARFAGINAP